MKSIILISGKQGAGKSTAAKLLADSYNSSGQSAVVLRFASVLYQMHDAIRKILASYGVDDMKSSTIDGPLLQVLGTEWGRNTRDENLWVRAFKSSAMSYWEAVPGGIVIVDDVRFPNELNIFEYDENVKKLLVRLDADRATRKARAAKWRENEDHISETALDDAYFDLVLDSSRESIGGICESIRSKFSGGL